MIEKLSKEVNVDIKKNISSPAWDESYLNRFFVDHSNSVHTYDPSYAYIDIRPIPKPFKKRIVHFVSKPRDLFQA